MKKMNLISIVESDDNNEENAINDGDNDNENEDIKMIDNKEINDEVKIVFISGNIDGADLEKSLLEIKCVKECLQKPVMIAKYQKILEKYYNNN